MDYDRDKVDEMVLALLWLTPAGDGRAWKGHNWEALDHLHAKGYISDPKIKAIKARGAFPSEDAALKVMYMALSNLARKWNALQGWKEALKRFALV